MARPEVLTTGEVAKYCHVNLRTVSRWIDRGLLKAYKLPGRGDNRVQRQDFLSFLKRNAMPIPGDLQESVSEGTDHTILMVDDEPLALRSMQLVLRKAKYRIYTAESGFKAGVFLETLEPDLILLDLKMNGLSGHDVIRYVRSHEDKFKKVKILVVSGASRGDLQKALEMGADAVLEKPVAARDLLEAIKTFMPKNEKAN